MAGPLTADQMACFDRDGFVIIRDFFPLDAVEEARKGLHALLETQIDRLNAATPGLLQPCTDSPFETRFLDVFSSLVKTDPDRVPLAFRPELHRREFYPLLFNARLLDAVQQLLPQTVTDLRLFPNYTARPKLPEFEPHRVLWHQDAGLDHRGAPNSAPEAERVHSFGRDAMVNVWTGFIPVGRPEGCMLMIPGTHKLGCVEHVLQGLARDPDATDVAADMDTMASDSDVRGYSQGYQRTDRATYSTSIHPDIVAREEAQCAPVPIETFPGDVVLFQNLTFHCGTANSSKSVRWSMDWRYQDADQPIDGLAVPGR